MKARTWLFAAAISVSGLALAQTATNPGVTTITDPAKIAEIERHAEQLKGNQPAAPMMDEHRVKQRQGMRHHKARKHHKPMHRGAKQEKAPADAPMATESKG